MIERPMLRPIHTVDGTEVIVRAVLLRTVDVVLLAALGMSALVSCGGSLGASYYDAGAGELVATSSEFGQNFLFRFDTADAARSFTLPSAADIVSSISSPVVGEVLIFGVTADGANEVMLIGGTNVTVKQSASIIQPNSTLTVYYVLDNVSSGTEAVTAY